MDLNQLEKIQKINRLSEKTLQFRDLNTLILGSFTKFGRKTVGETVFLSATKKQVAFAELKIRLVDSSTGRIFQCTPSEPYYDKKA